ncbi:GDP-mannose 4,6-dehydratase [Marine Group III euryarchaeote]|nr:GDP-mannose 4,6-dehydratase [Marine Group III euryarchaeote]
MSKSALITGVSGQDGAYLSRFLLEKGYHVIGGDRRTASGSLWRLKELGVHNNVQIVDLELSEISNIDRVTKKYMVDEVYNLAAQSFVGASFDVPLMTSDITGLGVVRLLECLRQNNPSTRFYQASTSEMFGKIQESPQTEKTKFYPRSPYGVAKLYAHWMSINYREAYNMFTSNGILFNHESPLRGEEFVTRKICMGVSRISSGDRLPIELGNLSAKRDWGFAGDYVEAMWLMLQTDVPDDFVVSSGSNKSVREFVEAAFQVIDIDIIWRGNREDEVGLCSKSKDILVKVNPEFYRPSEVQTLLGDFSKIKNQLGWSPKINFGSLVEMMVKRELERLQ